jgi:alpha-beta hydrolase superfamily lysophospholipase
MGAPTSRWAELGNFFAAQGFEVSAIQMRGWGSNAGKTPGHINSFKTYYRDIYKMIQHKLSQKNLPVFGLGESMGALILLGMQLDYPQVFKGLVLFAPALQDKLPFSPWRRAQIALTLPLCPWFAFKMPFNPEMTTRDPAMIKMMREDVNEKHVASPVTLLQNLQVRVKVRKNAEKFNLPIYIAQGGQDQFMNASVAEEFSKKSKNTRYVLYPEMYHGISIDLDKEKVFTDVLTWLNSLQVN